MGLFEFLKKKEPPKPAAGPRPMLRPMGFGLPPHPEPKAENNFIIVILDSSGCAAAREA